MKTITLNIHHRLEQVSIIVTNGKHFTDALIEGRYECFAFYPATAEDARRIKRFAITYADDKSSCYGSWYAHCNMFAMDLVVSHHKATSASLEHDTYTLNTYRAFGRSEKHDGYLNGKAVQRARSITHAY